MLPLELSNPIYTDEDAARGQLERIRWPDTRFCPYCGSTTKTEPLGGSSMGPGWFYCSDCQRKFTVRVGTIFERSHIPLHKWLLGFRLMASSKKGISAHQLHRTLGITYKSAWFMAHRIREAMKESFPGPLGGEGKVVEADETFIGPADWVFSNDKGWQQKRGTKTKLKVLTLVERGGRARSIKVESLKSDELGGYMKKNIKPETRVMTDEAQHYNKPGKHFVSHEAVNHGNKEYARGDVTTNTVEGYFSIFKRGMIGTYQHCGEQHLQRYLNEFDFRYSNRKMTDAERTEIAIQGAEGRRLKYVQPHKRVKA